MAITALLKPNLEAKNPYIGAIRNIPKEFTHFTLPIKVLSYI